MNPALRLLDEWTTHQDYFWFLALMAWGGVLGAEFPRRNHDQPVGHGWLTAFAACAAAGALLELVLLAQNLRIPYTRLDAFMGFAQAAGTGALAWGALGGRGRRKGWMVAIGVVLAALAVARVYFPVAAGTGLSLIHLGVVSALVTTSPRRLSVIAGILVGLVPVVATHGPIAYALHEGRSVTDWSHFAVLAASASVVAGVVVAAAVWRRRFDRVAAQMASSVLIRRELRWAVVTLAVWLVGGFLLAVWYGRIARRAFEENLLRRMDTAVLALDQRLLAEALGPELRITGFETKHYADGRPVVVATVPFTRSAVYASLRSQLARLREHNRDFSYLYVATWRSGQLLVLNSNPRLEDAITHVVHHAVGPADLERLAAGESFLEGPVTSESWQPQFSAKAALRHPVTGKLMGWLVADVAATRWMTTFTQVRLQTMALVGAGVGLWGMAVAYRLRREARDAAERRAVEFAAADRMKSAFLAKVSHELRTPIQSVLGYGELLAGSVTGEPQRGWLTALRSHGDIMLRLVNDLIDLGALQSGAFQLEPGAVNLRALVEDCTTALRPAARSKGLDFQCEVARGVPLWVRADGVRLRQVLLNLLNNAVKFTPSGRVRLDVLAAAGDVIAFVVTDTGPGIPDSLRPRLFQPFARLDPAAGGGSGLGLALVQGLCGVMGGTVELKGDASAGATFVVRLPLARCEPPDAVTPASPEVPASNRFAGLRVLVAEDNTLVSELLVAFLRDQGADVTVAPDGPTALARAREISPQVVLLDIGLPGMDGIAVAETLRREGRDGMRIVGLSAHVGPQDEARAREAGMDEFLAKPVRLARLAEVIDRQLREPVQAAHIADEQLRARLIAQFAQETPRILGELKEAWEARDWVRVRGRAHYLKNSADVLGLSKLQDACHEVVRLEEAPEFSRALRLLEAIETAIPPRLVSVNPSATDKE